MHCDASDYAISSLLTQIVDEDRQIIQIHSKTLSDTERRWPIREKEAYEWLWSAQKGKIARWAIRLQEYDFTIRYCPGTENDAADYISRNLDYHPHTEKLMDEASIPMIATITTNQEGPHQFAVLATPPTVDEIKAAQLAEIEGKRSIPLCTLSTVDGLYRHIHNHRIYVPPSLRNRICFFYHCGRFSGHSGVVRTDSRIKKTFWWPGIREDLETFIGKCLPCMRRRLPAPPHGNAQSVVADRPYAILAIDHIGPIKDHNGRPQHLFTMMDMFTRYLVVDVVPDVGAATTVASLRRSWFRPHRPPAVLLSDRGPAFVSDAFQHFLRALGVTHALTSPHNPTGNSALERSHAEIRHAVNTCIETWSGDLQTAVDSAVWSHNSLPNRSTGETPAFILTGVDMCPGLHGAAHPIHLGLND
eukprot:GHVO01033665.1.p1 GENE.GHVO01033665.1~~GHVO01033665.1.p1  ORF type:complete len:417 (+),score=15.99 GHVO01033665.1:732-1982(+)